MFLQFFQKFSLVLLLIGFAASSSKVEVKLVSATITTAAVGSAPKPYMVWTVGGTSKTSSTVTPATYSPTWNEDAMIWASVTDTNLESVVLEMWDEYSGILPDVRLTSTAWNISAFKSTSTSRVRKTVNLWRTSDTSSATGGSVSVDIAVICATCSTPQECCTACQTGIYSGTSGCSCSSTNGVCSCGGTTCSTPSTPQECCAACKSGIYSGTSGCSCTSTNGVCSCGGSSCPSSSTCGSVCTTCNASSTQCYSSTNAYGDCWWSSTYGCRDSDDVASCSSSDSCATCKSKYECTQTRTGCAWSTSSNTCSGTTTVCDTVCSNCNASSTQCYSSTNPTGDCWWSSTYGCRDANDVASCASYSSCATCRSKYECNGKGSCTWSTSSNTCSETTTVCGSVCTTCNASSTQCYSSTNPTGDCWWSSTYGCRDADDVASCSSSDSCATCKSKYECTQTRTGCTWTTSSNTCSATTSGTCSGTDCFTCPTSNSCAGKSGCTWSGTACEDTFVPCAGPQCSSCSSSQSCWENGCWWINNSCTTSGIYEGYDVLDLLTQELVTCGDIVGPYIQYCDHFPVCYRSGDQCLYDYCTYGLLYLHQSKYTQVDCDGVSNWIASMSLGNVDCSPISWRGWSTCHLSANRIDDCFDVATTTQLAQTCSGPDGCYAFAFDVPELGIANGRGCWNASTTGGNEGEGEGEGGNEGDNSAAPSIRVSFIYVAFALIAALLLLN